MTPFSLLLAPFNLEPLMLAQDKLYVVLAVVLIIWFGLIAAVVRTDRRLRGLEEALDRHPAASAEPR